MRWARQSSSGAGGTYHSINLVFLFLIIDNEYFKVKNIKIMFA
jgi:hypothetical protein